MITPDMIPAMDGIVPSIIGTTSADGIPNITYVSQVFYVDDTHVALSFQFMNKTWANISANPNITLILTDPDTFSIWELQLCYERMVNEGPLFDTMDMQISAIASMFTKAAHFKLRSALICRVNHVKIVHYAR